MSASPAPVTAEPFTSDGPIGRRLVVISYHFPPDGFIGGMRWAGLTKYLAALGWRSWVVTAAPPGEAPVPGVTVESCPPWRTVNDRYQQFRVRTSTARGGSPAGTEGRRQRGGPQAAWLARLRLEAAMLLALPDQARGWIVPAARQARRVIAQIQPDVVVSSGPPHSAHLVAWLATRGRRVRWMMDLRDPWAGPVSTGWRSSPYHRSHIARWLTAGLERIAVRSASGILCNTREFAAAMKGLHPDASVRWFPNGVDAALLPPASDDHYPGVGIAYAGTLYGGRDARPLVRGLRLFLDRHPQAAAEGTKLRIAGDIAPYLAEPLWREVTALGLNERVEALGMLRRAEALRVQGRSRLAVVLAQDQEMEVPAKLYELAAMNVPTLVLAPAGTATASEARRIGAIAVDPADVDAIACLLEDVWLGRFTAIRPAQGMIDYRDLATVADRILVSDADAGDLAGVAGPNPTTVL